MSTAKVQRHQAATHDGDQAVAHAKQQRKAQQHGQVAAQRKQHQRHRQPGQHAQAQPAQRPAPTQPGKHQPARHLRRPHRHQHDQGMGLIDLLGREHRHHMRPQRGRHKRMQHETQREQPERRHAQGLAQRGVVLLMARVGGDHQCRAAQRPVVERRHHPDQHRRNHQQSGAPTQRRQQQRDARVRQRAGKTAQQREHGDGVRVALGIAFGQHAEGRLVERGGHCRAHQHPGGVQHPGCAHLRPGRKAQGAQQRAAAHHAPAVAGVDPGTHHVSAGPAHRQAQREGAHQGGAAPAECGLHRQHERREGVIQPRPAQNLAQRQSGHGGAVARAGSGRSSRHGGRGGRSRQHGLELSRPPPWARAAPVTALSRGDVSPGRRARRRVAPPLSPQGQSGCERSC